jgi:hypothetical protein
MIVASTLALLLAVAGAGPAPAPAISRIEIAQLIIRERVIVRVPTRPARAPAIKWKEKKGPKCISAEGLAGAALIDQDSVDLIARGGERTRAQLESACPAIDFYSGFYLMPSADRQVCAGRDSVHARSGGECQIKRFRKLVPAE